MKLIILDPRRGVSRTLEFPRHWPWLLALVLFLLPMLGAAGGYWLHAGWQGDQVPQGLDKPAVAAWRVRIDEQRQAIVDARNRAEERLKTLTVRVAEMQSRLLRLDALGERLARTARIGHDDFDFSRPPPVGGPEDTDAASEPAFRQPDFVKALDQLSARIDARADELGVLENLLDSGRLREERFLAGNPIAHGYLSSAFGRRIDPFHGDLAFHQGIDFAGPEGADIVATGAGIVIAAGEKNGYGLMVEINHGGGISTVYGHASKVLVAVGDIVREGQPIARIGTTGRSTGPHVHYEVRVNGVAIDPAGFLANAGTVTPAASAAATETVAPLSPAATIR